MVSGARTAAEEVFDLGGIAVLNLHPYVCAPRPGFHDTLLDWAADLADVCVATQKDTIDRVVGDAQLRTKYTQSAV